jgi:hypothetical protein
LSDLPGQIRQEALSVLRGMRLWKLPHTRWEAIAGILASMTAELEAGNLDAVAEATVQLEIAGPVRLDWIGAPPAEEPPPPVRERINRLIHQLSGEDSGKDSGADGDQT